MRKYFSVNAFFLLFTFASSAQNPQLTVDGKTNNGIQLKELKIEVKVCGTVARTTWQMTFKNTTSTILEGTLNFPLKDGLSVSRYALDINGKMRDAVPIDRAKGTEVFEAIERRRVDPGLLEKVDGNTFRTRIYPINPNNTRTVIIGYEEDLPAGTNASLHYYLPLNLKDTVADFSLDVSVIQSAIQPVFDSSLNENIRFNTRNNQYLASLNKKNYVPGYSLSFSIPKPLDATEVMLQEFENKYYYLVNTTLQKNIRDKILPASVGLLWDASLSGSTRNAEKEKALLDAYFKKLNNASVKLVVFSNTIKTTKQFFIQNGNWEALKNFIEGIHYDGATNLGNLHLKNINADEFLLVSDGHQTLGNGQVQLSTKPVYCINSSATADYSNLKFIAGKTSGLVIDLGTITVSEALKKLIHEPFRFLGIKQNEFIQENYPSIPVVVNTNFSVAGIAEEGIQEVILQFGYGNKVTYEKKISINPESQLCEYFDITKVFAQKKIAELDIQYNQNKTEIERLGKQFGIVTRNSSLIVLETVSDYIQYKIEPPAELRAEYNRIMKQQRNDVITKQNDELKKTLDMIVDLRAWYNKNPVNNESSKKETVAVTIPTPVQTNPVPVTQIAPPVAMPSGNSKIITGNVTDIDGNPVSFASIKIKGSATGVSADANGKYSMRVRSGDVLVISGASFKETEVQVGQPLDINTVLEPTGSELKEVVVTSAFGIRRTARSTSSNVQTVSGDQSNMIRQTNISNALAGKVSGAEVRSQSFAKPGAETTVRLRGENGFGLGSGALLVVDGNIMQGGTYINPANVEDYSILQGPAAASLFGPDGSNGAVIITTKNVKRDSAFKKTLDKTGEENSINQSLKPLFDIKTFDYIKEIKQTEKNSRYLKYLELRQYYISKPTYFFEVAAYLLKTGDSANGLTVLSNLAELENGSYELYKMLGYKLKEAGDYEGELSAFKKVMELRPSDPQSYRDCALAYKDLGNYQKSLDMLYEGMTKSYSDEMNEMYDGIEEIFLTEINHIIALHKNKLNLKKIDKRIIAPMQAGIRVVMNWNMNNTDIDLWVTDPNGEKCLYSNSETQTGGRLSEDFTEGFGPEQFMIKKGVKGKYKIEIDYYSDTQVNIAGPTTIMAEIYLYFGTDKEVKKIITLQMQKDKEGAVFIGEVEL
jgi:tetratricopeptide (TPR) repeat protein